MQSTVSSSCKEIIGTLTSIPLQANPIKTTACMILPKILQAVECNCIERDFPNSIMP